MPCGLQADARVGAASAAEARLRDALALALDASSTGAQAAALLAAHERGAEAAAALAAGQQQAQAVQRQAAAAAGAVSAAQQQLRRNDLTEAERVCGDWHIPDWTIEEG